MNALKVQQNSGAERAALAEADVEEAIATREGDVRAGVARHANRVRIPGGPKSND